MSMGDILPWRRDNRSRGGVGSLVFDQERRAQSPKAPPAAKTAKTGSKARRKKPAIH